MPTILIAEDNLDNRELLKKFLEREGFDVLVDENGEEALLLAPQANLIILDAVMPKVDGWEVLQILREDNTEVPIMMLTALTSPDDEIRGWDLGLDDFISKPYDFRILRARIKVLLRRSGLHDELVFGKLRIMPNKREVYLDNRLLQLSKVEFDLLLTLAQYPGNVFSRDMLLERLWGSDYFGTERVVDVRMVALRRKLEEASSKTQFIETVRGMGYRFKPLHEGFIGAN
jgi:two-component system, OmpR family, alkaline phosphatase synthesis response regulator PhoP